MAAWSSYGIRFGIALVTALLITLAVRTVARRYGWVARPRADRWHRKPTALFGGVGIIVGFLAAYFWGGRPASFSGNAMLVVCATAMFLLGLADDRWRLKPYAKLIGQLAIATLFTIYGLRLHWLPNMILDQGLTIFWLVGVTNALNLLDNIDGAAAGIATIASLYMVFFCHSAGQFAAATMAAGFAGATVGFLVLNFNPASIFMGDCGSLFLGFFLGGFSVATMQVGTRRDLLATLSIPVLLLLIPIIDTALVTVSRRYYGRSISQGGRDHTSHRLVALGFSERAATLALWTMAAVSGAIAVMVQELSTMIAIAIVALFGMAILFLMIFVGRVKIYAAATPEDESHGRALLPTLADFTHKRRIFEVLNDLVLIMFSYYAAFLLRFEGAITPEFFWGFVTSLPVVIVAQLASFLSLGLYRGLWRYTGLDDLQVIIKSVAAAVVLSMASVLLLFRFVNLSRAVFIIDGMLLLLTISGSRISFRLLRNWLLKRSGEGQRVIIYGAGDGGEILVREFQNNRRLGLMPVGFIDDDPQKLGRIIHGVRVLGAFSELPRIIAAERVDKLVISTTSLTPERVAEISQLCVNQGINFRRMRIIIEEDSDWSEKHLSQA